ncbi:hypothetical protein ACUXAV_002937 [Cupriavidus metallidurans]|nr:hypothetical protein AU374_04695 [Cupriavidus metallidurans]
MPLRPRQRAGHRLENPVAKHFDPLHALPHALWWQPGVYGSVPAVLLWIVARLPAEALASVFSTPYASALFNHAGDTVFVTGWLASAVWLWFTRKKPNLPDRNVAPAGDERPAAGQHAPHHGHRPG